jgi:hypothetical protein
MSTLLKNLLIALGLSVILFVGYLAFFKDSGGTQSSVSAPEGAKAELEGQALLSTLSEVRSLDVGGELLSDPLFLSLRDLRTQLGEEPKGRTNPFVTAE